MKSTATPVVKFKVSKKVKALITQVAKRYLGKWDHATLLDLEMDLTAVHCNDVRLDFERMLKADRSQLGHDIGGIQRHLDRRTGKLTCHFVPRLLFRPDYVNTHIKKPKVRNPYLPTPQDHAAAILAKKRHADALAGEPKSEQPESAAANSVPLTGKERKRRKVEDARQAQRAACPRSRVRDLRRKRGTGQESQEPGVH